MKYMFEDLYTSGEYLKKNPTWHVGESPWKAREIMRMMVHNNLAPKTVCEVGCGAGEILKLLQEHMNGECTFWGYEISPQAFALCKSRANARLQFKLLDIRQEENIFFDLILVMDVLEHLEDYFSFLREVKSKSEYKIIHIPIDISVRSVLRGYLTNYRRSYGHIHYFTKEIALQMLQDLGFEVLDYFYTLESIIPINHLLENIERNPQKRLKRFLGKIKRGLPNWLEKLLFTINKDFAVRIMGRRRLLILVK
jgi:SAM-dependent methyltransferase